MKNIKLDDFEIEDIEDQIPEIEKIYNIKLEINELNTITNFDDLCNLIINNIKLKHIDSCTYQHIFYKLRNCINELKIIDKDKFSPETELKNIISSKNKNQLIKKIENDLNIKMDIYKIPIYIDNILSIIFFISLISLFINFKIGLIGIIFYISTFMLIKLVTNKLKFKTLRELIINIASENYLSVRKEKNSVNKNELKQILLVWFSENTGINKQKLIHSTF